MLGRIKIHFWPFPVWPQVCARFEPCRVASRYSPSSHPAVHAVARRCPTAKQQDAGLYACNNTKQLATSGYVCRRTITACCLEQDGGNVGKPQPRSAGSAAAWILAPEKDKHEDCIFGYHDSIPIRRFLGPYVKKNFSASNVGNRCSVNIGAGLASGRSISMNVLCRQGATGTNPSKYKQCQKSTDIGSNMMFLFWTNAGHASTRLVENR